ncbi:MAG: hypothetical protein IH984_07090 [Planctomycetes bacterium]|nr:hypothetical protein [Planctomycetota bacterium]
MSVLTTPEAVGAQVLDGIEKRLGPYLEGRKFSTEIATTFNFVLFDEFKKLRECDSGTLNLKPVFVGEYFVDPENPEQTRVYSHQGSEACSPIPITSGVIGRAVRTGEDQYVPDVREDPEHVGCDPKMEGTELVLIAWSEPYLSGSHKGCTVPLGVLDIDLNVTDALAAPERLRLRSVWAKYCNSIFPGEPSFQPQGELFVAQP